jgi:hypothetical protein
MTVMSEEIRRRLLVRAAIRSIEDLLYVIDHDCAPPIDWRGPEHSKLTPEQQQPTPQA